MKTRYLFLAVLMFALTNVFGQKTNETEKKEEKKIEKKSEKVFKLDGQFRTLMQFSPSAGGRNLMVPENYHYWNPAMGDDVKTPSGLSMWQRSRITATYKTPQLVTKLSVQDVRAFGSNLNGAGQQFADPAINTLGVYEAWAKYNFINNEERTLGLKIGRQEFKFADARLMWNKDWVDAGATYDAVNLQYTCKKGMKADLGVIYNSVDAPGTAANYRMLGFLNVNAKINDMITVNVTDLMQKKEHNIDTTYTTNTIGFNPIVKVSDLIFNASFYYKTGAQDEDVSYAAMMYTANLAYKIGKFKVGAGYDSYSGEAYDDDQTDNKNKVFTTPFAGMHKYFGNTDMHLKMFGKKRGANDINIKAGGKVTKKTSLGLQFHMISFAKEHMYVNYAAEEVTYKNVGNNIDFTVAHGFGKGMAVKGGVSVFMPSADYTTETKMYSWGMAEDDNLKTHTWAWLMFIYKPNFFTSK